VNAPPAETNTKPIGRERFAEDIYTRSWVRFMIRTKGNHTDRLSVPPSL
jgi:hypothetical protein